MRVRKIAKQIKRWQRNITFDKDEEPIYNYKVGALQAKQDYIVRMSRKHYFGLRNKYPVGSMMWKYYTHKACSYDLYDDIMMFWGINTYE